MNAHRSPLNVPVDHDAAAAVANMPFGYQVLDDTGWGYSKAWWHDGTTHFLSSPKSADVQKPRLVEFDAASDRSGLGQTLDRSANSCHCGVNIKLPG
jgi:hypothetical protein